MRQGRPKPLYRKVNTRTHHVRHASSAADARWFRGAKPGARTESAQKTMKQGVRHGLDYTPLYRFLLKNVGQSWDLVHREASARLESEAPIWHIVARPGSEGRRVVRGGESSYWSGLFVADDGTLQKVDHALAVEQLYPNCTCCTHTFNGVRFLNRFDANRGFFGNEIENRREEN